MTALRSYPALYRALCIFHGRVIPGDIDVPQIWSARFRLADRYCADMQNPQWFAMVNRLSDLDRMFPREAQRKIMSQVFFEWEPQR